MKRILSVLILTPAIFAGVVPNRYIVELQTEPVLEHAARVRSRGENPRAAMRKPEIAQHRARIRGEQQSVRAQLEQESGVVLHTVENVANALIVEIPDAQAARLASLPGVKKVHPVREFHLVLDHALALHKVPEAWSQVGYGNAGAGVKIGIIDTGVDQSHPGFVDSSMPAPPDGFPKASSDTDLAFTNSKVIVARSYASLFARPDTDTTPRDHVGHGTATAMCAAGVQNTGPLATITGVAPRAWIGSYKVFGTPGVNDSSNDAAIIKAMDDAVVDGMDIISMSLGSDLETRLADDPEVAAVERISAMGILVVASSGNNGPDPATVGSPGNSPSALTVGATWNDRRFSANAKVGEETPVIAVPGAGPNSKTPISGPLVDVATLDGDGLACGALPQGSLEGSIAFIARGVCTFEVKLNTAAGAGAIAALVFSDEARPDPGTMAVGTATLPAQMISFADGTAIKHRLRSPQQAVLQFTLGPAYVDPSRIADFSSQGPSVEFAIKPEIVAVGRDLYMAAQKADARGVMYSADGYVIEQGTSFSAPMVAGAAAVLKSARPGLTAAQYRSLLVGTAAQSYFSPGVSSTVQQAGAGQLDLSAALNATATAVPATLSYGAGTSDVNLSRTLTITNVGNAQDTFLLNAVATVAGVAPTVQPASLDLAPGSSAEVTVTLKASALDAGNYEGYVTVQGANAPTPTRVPFWFGVRGGAPKHVTVLSSSTSARAGATVADAVIFKVTDAAGMPIAAPALDVTVTGNAEVTSVRSRSNIYPNAYSVTMRFGLAGGSAVVHIKAGDITRDVTISAR